MTQWIEGSTVGVVSDYPAQHGPVMFLNTHTGVGITSDYAGTAFQSTPTKRFPQSAWTAIDLTGLVPIGTKAVCLHGILITTHSLPTGTESVTLAVRKHDSDLTGQPGFASPLNYTLQVVDVFQGSGQRSPCTVWCPLDADLKLDVRWTQIGLAGAVGINMHVVSYLR